MRLPHINQWLEIHPGSQLAEEKPADLELQLLDSSEGKSTRSNGHNC